MFDLASWVTGAEKAQTAEASLAKVLTKANLIQAG
jgi:hypothetical protein